MPFRYALAALALFALVGCGQIESVQAPTPTFLSTATPAPPGSTPDPNETPATDGFFVITPTGEAQPTLTPIGYPIPTPKPSVTPTRVGYPAPQPSPATSNGTQGQAMQERARAALAASLKVAPETLTLVQTEDVEWPNSALGCPSPGQAYMQVIIPGQRIVFTDGKSTYTVHTDDRGSRMIWCNAGNATALR